MNKLIEGYLRTGGVRYFRGHHDDEYFHLVHTRAGRLYVHLEVCGDDRDSVQISVSPNRFYPAGRGDRLQRIVARWNAECHEVGALVQNSSDPNLVAVAAGSRHRGSDPVAFAQFVDRSLADAVELFGLIDDVGGPTAPPLRNAG